MKSFIDEYQPEFFLVFGILLGFLGGFFLGFIFFDSDDVREVVKLVEVPDEGLNQKLEQVSEKLDRLENPLKYDSNYRLCEWSDLGCEEGEYVEKGFWERLEE